MPWKLDSQKPIYAQLVEKVQLDIVTGRYQPGKSCPLCGSWRLRLPSIPIPCRKRFPSWRAAACCMPCGPAADL